MSSIVTDLNRFYGLLSQLESDVSQGQPLGKCGGKASFPQRGVYFFRESGECRESQPIVARIVRVGTHAVSTAAKSTLRGRLKNHLGTRSGGGNHRGSIFRMHVGAALLARDHVSISTWGKGSSPPAEVRESQAARDAEAGLERKVSEYISAMPVLWVDVPDEPSANSLRAIIERNAIALLSNQLSPIEAANEAWLGHHSPRERIRNSGLWNLNHVDLTYDSTFLDALEIAIDRTLR